MCAVRNTEGVNGFHPDGFTAISHKCGGLKCDDVASMVGFIGQNIDKYISVLAARLKEYHCFGDDRFWRLALFHHVKYVLGAAWYYYHVLDATYDHDRVVLCSPECSFSRPLMTLDECHSATWPSGEGFFIRTYYETFNQEFLQVDPIALRRIGQSPLIIENYGSCSVCYDDHLLSRAASRVINKLGGIVDRAAGLFASRRLQLMITDVVCDPWINRELLLASRLRAQSVFTDKAQSLLAGVPLFDYQQLSLILGDCSGHQSTRFDQYFWACICASLPISLLEGFSALYDHYNQFFGDYESLRVVMSEMMYQENSLFLAVAQYRGLTLMRCPHFFFVEYYLGHSVNRLLWDEYDVVRRGGRDLSNMGEGVCGSLYKYGYRRRESKIPLLYLPTDYYSGFLPYETLVDGRGDYLFVMFNQFVNEFFLALPLDLKRKMCLKKRPHGVFSVMSLDYGDDVGYISPDLPATKVIPYAGLVLVEGLSTSFLEALVSNIPVVMFYPDIYVEAPGYEGYLDRFKGLSVVFNDPLSLAEHVSSVYERPEAWWYSEAVQSARSSFLNDYVSGPDLFIESILGHLD